jgi:hypothetical protein
VGAVTMKKIHIMTYLGYLNTGFEGRIRRVDYAKGMQKC